MNKKVYKKYSQVLATFEDIANLRIDLNWSKKNEKEAEKLCQKAQGDWQIVMTKNLIFWQKITKEAKGSLRDALNEFHTLLNPKHHERKQTP